LLLAALFAGCSAAPTALPGPSFLANDAKAKPEPSKESPEAKETPDPLEAMNRQVFEANQAINHAVVYPVAKAYREGVPEVVRDRVDAFFTNLSEPMVMANNVLQLRFDAAATTFTRFITNSTIGVAGLFDVAATMGQKHQSGDFGQTLYVWGVRDTAYLVLPVLGPTNVRDGFGTGVGLLAPMGVVSIVPARLATATGQVSTVDTVGRPVAGLGKVEMMEELEATSLDFYAMLRSMSDQKRQAELQQALDESLLSGPFKDATPAAPGIYRTVETPTTTGAATAPPASLGGPRKSTR
jgi:phospholipid-binding lipoprotein MlaA